jgi:hypothetical protein
MMTKQPHDDKTASSSQNSLMMTKQPHDEHPHEDKTS